MTTLVTFLRSDLRSYVLALSWLLVASCSLIESPKESAPSPVSTQVPSVNLVSEGNYLETCRTNGVPIPPDWTRSSSEWESHGNLKTILLTPNSLDEAPVDETSFASVWSYAPPQRRGACIALGRSSGSFQIICQSATTGYACFWGNDTHSPNTRWTPESSEVRIASLRDPAQGFPSETVPCTDCHRGNNAFLYAPDDPAWATVLRPERARPMFTTRVEQPISHQPDSSGEATRSSPRFIPIGGKSMNLDNPLPTVTGCSGSCHELHVAMLKKNYSVEGYVRIPRPMGPNCAAHSPPDDPTRNCYQK